MDKIPSETLIKIFNYLHLKQKLQCMLVCRLWARILVNDDYIIETVSLLSLPSSESLNRRVNELINKASKNNNPAGTKCKRLLLDNTSGGISVDKASLAKALPNLKFAFFRSEGFMNGWGVQGNDSSTDLTRDQFDSFQNWRNTLETVIDWTLESFFFNTLKTGIFNRLTTLALQLPSFGSSSALNLKPLKYAPNVTTLYISICRIDVDVLEELHSCIPGLVSLNIAGNLNFNADSVKSRKIISATQLKSFRTTDMFRCNNDEGLLLYISKKYISLDELHLPQNISIFRTSRLKPPSFAWIELLVAIGPNLSKCTTGFQNDMNYIDSLLQYAPNLKSFHIDSYKYNTLFQHDLTHPLFQYLHTLALFEVPSTIELSKLNTLKGLQKLELNYGSSLRVGSIMFDNTINRLPENVKTLILKNATLTIDKNMEDITQQSNVTHLKLIQVEIDRPATKFIETHFLNLKSLSLYYCKKINGLDLSNLHLSFVEIIPFSQTLSMGGANNHDIKLLYARANTHLQLTISDQTRYYNVPILDSCRCKPLNAPTLDVHDHAIQHVLKPSLYDDDLNLNYFHFECASVQSFYFCDYLVM